MADQWAHSLDCAEGEAKTMCYPRTQTESAGSLGKDPSTHCVPKQILNGLKVGNKKGRMQCTKKIQNISIIGEESALPA